MVTSKTELPGVSLLAIGIGAVLAGLIVRGWVFMLAMGVVNVNSSWRESLLASVLLSFTFFSFKVTGSES